MRLAIASIVEGHGDVEALPALLGKLAPGVEIKRPVRVPKSKLISAAGTANQDEVSRAVAIAVANIPHDVRGLLLLVLDADSDCAAEIGPSLLAAMNAADHRGTRECFVAIAKKEFESWLLGGLLESDESDPDGFGNPKGRVGQLNGGRYKETIDQPRLAKRVIIDQLESRSPSFQRLATQIRRFCEHR